MDTIFDWLMVAVVALMWVLVVWEHRRLQKELDRE